MILHIGERVYWGAPEVIYLEGTIAALDEKAQSAVVHIEGATPHSAHLIGSNVPFAVDGLMPLKGASPPGVTRERSERRLPARKMSDEEMINAAAIAAVHQQYGYELPAAQEQILIEQVTQILNTDAQMRAQIIASMNEILQREL